MPLSSILAISIPNQGLRAEAMDASFYRYEWCYSGPNKTPLKRAGAFKSRFIAAF
jgi:hypothetical protein